MRPHAKDPVPSAAPMQALRRSATVLFSVMLVTYLQNADGGATKPQGKPGDYHYLDRVWDRGDSHISIFGVQPSGMLFCFNPLCPILCPPCA